MENYDLIVIGSGHAGVEAALAGARMGCRSLLLTMSADQIATMSCNPAVGGLGKSQLAKEVDLLGGAMAEIADASAMQYRVLNERKGPAVRATRVHVDRHEYRARMKERVESEENLQLKQAQVTKLIFSAGGRLQGVETQFGQRFGARAVIVTTGTFMNGKAHVGKLQFMSGRAGEPPSIGLSDFLRAMGIRLGRYKTGTVPRVDAKTINWKVVEEQKSDTKCLPLSVFSDSLRNDLESAHLSFTNPRTHELIRGSLSESPLYTGIIESRGPRYCPSVEDKITRFADKDRHQVFLEREGRHTQEVYVGGVSTSLPYQAQLEFLRSIKGLEKVEIIRPGYAIEYDYLDSTQLDNRLQLIDMEGLYFAGQVNGTSGYEEAAAQGLWAGVNAACYVLEKEAFELGRHEAYMGVLIDDLVVKGTMEPYRMLSSRAEWRLLLREDNVEERLYEKALRFGLLNESKRKSLELKIQRFEELRRFAGSYRIRPSEQIELRFKARSMEPPKSGVSLQDLMKRPEVDHEFLSELGVFENLDFSKSEWTKLFADIRYEGYIKQARSQLEQVRRLEEWRLGADIDYSSIAGLPNEAVEKLSALRPSSLGQASRIEGVTPASISVLAIYLSRHNKVACVNE